MKNKTLFILFLALCPLAVLTFFSLKDFFSVPPRSAPDDKVLIQEVDAEGPERLESLRVAEALQAGLGDVQLIFSLDAETSPFLRNMTRYGVYSNDAAYLKSWSPILGNLADTLQPLRKINAKSLADVEEMTPENVEISNAAFESVQKAQGRMNRYVQQLNGSLTDYAKVNPNSKLASNSENIQKKMTEMTELISERVLRAKEIHQAKASFLEAQKLFDSSEWQKCNKLCGKVLANKKLDDSFLKKVRKLNYQARAKRGLEELTEIEASKFRLESKLEQLEELGARVTEAGEGLSRDEKQSLASDFQEKMNSLFVVYIEETCTKEIQRDLADLEKDVNQGFVDALQDAGGIAKKIAAMDLKIRKCTGEDETAPAVKDFQKILRTDLVNILNAVLPSEVECNEDIQEAELRDGKIITGYFRPIEENGKTTGYKIYTSYEEYKNPTGSIGVTPVEDFRSKPGPSLESRCAKNYILAREKLLSNVESRKSWNEFLGKCEQMTQDLQKWEEKSQLKASFSFKIPLSIAKGVLKKENWEIMNIIFK